MKKTDRVAMLVLIIILGSISIWLANLTSDLKAEVAELQAQPPITKTVTVTTITNWTPTEPRYYTVTETLTETTTEVLRLTIYKTITVVGGE
jgi:hypothetical protein